MQIHSFKAIRIHILCWLVFLIYDFLITRVVTGRFAFWEDYLVHYSLNIFLFYFHAHVVLPRIASLRRLSLISKSLVAIVIISSEILFYFLVTYVVESISIYGFNARFELAKPLTNLLIIVRRVWRVIYFFAFSTGYYYLYTYLKERDRAEALEKERLNNLIHVQQTKKEIAKAENAYLRAQINPHFLFNTLNFIYNNTRKKAPLAAESILILSELMRYAIDRHAEGLIKIQDEISQIRLLLQLHQLRHKHPLYFNIDIAEDVMTVKIIPLILLGLAENMFKHGDLLIERHPAYIRACFKNNDLHITTVNLRKDSSANSGLQSGLENIRRRISLSYGEGGHFRYYSDHLQHFYTEVRIKREMLDKLPALNVS